MKIKYLFTVITILQALNLVWVISTEQPISLIAFTAFVLGCIIFFTFTGWVKDE